MSQKERVEDAQTIINLFAQQYAPLKWKEENLGINFNELASRFISDAGSARTDKDFYRSMALFLSSFKDAHVSYTLPSSLISYLDFNTEYFDDGVIITGVNRAKLPEDMFPFKRGDRLIAMDDIPVEKIIDSLSIFEENGYGPANRKMIGTWYLTYRPQKRFVEVPSGPVKITVLPRGENSPKDVILEWGQKGADISEMPPKSAASYMAKALMQPLDNAIAEGPIEDFERSHYVEQGGRNSAYSIMGDPMPFFPVWENFEQRMLRPYFSGVFTLNGYRIGFIRIETWSVGNYFEYIKKFAQEMEYMNDNTDALVIDQTGNGGGNICYPFHIGSFFITKPMKQMSFQLRANRSHLSRIEGWYASSASDETVHAKAWVDALRASVENGEHLSAPISAFCSLNGQVFPYRDKNEYIKLYIKPLLILINEMDFSAADMFPAFMQDWGAAKLFGARTAGAGGNVVQSDYIGNSEITIRLTQSLMHRSGEVALPNGRTTHYVENVGVTPDYRYDITTEDFFNEYKDYREGIDNAVLDMLNNR